MNIIILQAGRRTSRNPFSHLNTLVRKWKDFVALHVFVGKHFLLSSDTTPLHLVLNPPIIPAPISSSMLIHCSGIQHFIMMIVVGGRLTQKRILQRTLLFSSSSPSFFAIVHGGWLKGGSQQKRNFILVHSPSVLPFTLPTPLNIPRGVCPSIISLVSCV